MKGDYKRIRRHLAKLDWSAILNNNSLGACWDIVNLKLRLY